MNKYDIIMIELSINIDILSAEIKNTIYKDFDLLIQAIINLHILILSKMP